LITSDHFHLFTKFARPVISALLVFLFINHSFAQDCDSAYLKLNKAYLLSYIDDAGDIATSPLRWDNKEWLGFAGVTAATLLVYSQDAEIRDFFQRNRTDQKDEFTKHFFDPLGTYYLVGIVGGMYVYGLATKNQKAETAGLLTGKAVALTGAYTFLFKNLFQRKRPYESDPPDPNYWGGPFDGFNHNSFPSGHTSVVFAAATVLSGYYHEKKWVGITAFSLAGLVAISRNYDDKHWASDIVAGAALGYSIGKLVCSKQRQKALQVTPYGSLYGQGLTLTYRF
jgi:membrane-associated phospholipid phosphatase